MSDIINMLCRIVATLVEVTKESNGARMTKDNNITMSFECDGRKHTACISVEEAEE